MKKSAIALFGALAVFACGCIFPAQTVSAAETDAIYLGERVARGSFEGVGQSYASIARGESAARYAFESGENNKFLRLANFDGAADSDRTSVVFVCGGTFTEATVTFSYRLFEGECAYADDAPVLTAELRGVSHTLVYGELEASVSEDMAWHTVSFPMKGLMGTSDRLTLALHFPAAGMYGETRLCADIDNVSVLAGEERVAAGDLEFAEVSASDEKIYERPARGDRGLTLSGDDAVRFEENTELAYSVRENFDNGLYASPLARQGSAGTFHTAANAASGGSDIYAVYDPYAENTFLRLSNVNGTIGETQLTTYFYDNRTGSLGNMPVTEQIFVSFRYRLFIDGYIRAGMRGDEVILNLSTRSSAANHAGEISLDELILNEAGDDTWHTFSGVLDVRRNTTAYMIVTYYAHADSSYASDTFFDLDDLVLSPSVNGANYAHLGGGFEGLAENGGESALFFREELGAPAQKRAVDSLDGEMLLGAGETFSLRVSMPRTTNVFYAAFDVSAPSGAEFAVRLGGRSGDRLSLTVGQNTEGDLSVAWEGAGNAWRCRLYYARAAYAPVTSFDFVNGGTESIAIDNFYAGQVVSVSAEAGDYAAYSAALAEYKATIEGEAFTTASRLTFGRLLWTADRITENGSQARMDAALAAIGAAISSAARKADMTELNEAIAEAEKTLAQRDPAEYEKQARLNFFASLSAARNVTDEDTQDAVDRAAENLRSATAALVPVQADAAQTPVAVVAVSAGGAAVGAGSLLGICLTKRRFL